MRKWFCVPMITLCLLLTSCGGAEEETMDIRQPYRDMTGCEMEAKVTCTQFDRLWEAELKCDWTAEESRVEVLAPEHIAGVTAALRGEELSLEYEDLCLDAGTLSSQRISPAACLPRLMSALQEGWLLEENEEVWGETSCRRLALDQSGGDGGKIVSTLWLNEEGMPLRGEIAVDGEIILTAEFTAFAFYDTITGQEGAPSET